MLYLNQILGLSGSFKMAFNRRPSAASSFGRPRDISLLGVGGQFDFAQDNTSSSDRDALTSDSHNQLLGSPSQNENISLVSRSRNPPHADRHS